MLKKFYMFLGAGLIGAYLTTSVMGMELTSSKRNTIKEKDRRSRSSMRAYFFAPIFFRRGK